MTKEAETPKKAAPKKAAAKVAPEAVPDYETGVKRIDAIVSQLEQGEIPLEQALALFEEGISLTRTVSAMLDAAEQKVFMLLQKEDGGHYAAPLEDGEI